ncbi:MAG: SxtJ family membrane protein [Planctomycetota bacterium]|jgi:hypothetical protein
MESKRKELRKFGLVVGGVFAALALYFLLRYGWPSLAGRILGGLGAALLLASAVYPRALIPFRRVWMALAHVLGWINTRLILGAVYYLAFTLVRFFLVLLRKDPMHRRPDAKLATYWVDVPQAPFERESLEHQY